MANSEQKHLEGEFHSWDIATREGTSEIQVFRNFQTALKNAGFALDYTNSPSQIVAHNAATWIFIDNRGTYYYQTIVTTKEMKQEVTADASTLPMNSVNPDAWRFTALISTRARPRYCRTPKMC